jgi:hypothetical protein
MNSREIGENKNVAMLEADYITLLIAPGVNNKSGTNLIHACATWHSGRTSFGGGANLVGR